MSTKTALFLISNQQFRNRNDWNNYKKSITNKFKGMVIHAFHHKIDSREDFRIERFDKIFMVFEECLHSTIKTKIHKIKRVSQGKNISFFSINSYRDHPQIEGVLPINEIQELLSA